MKRQHPLFSPIGCGMSLVFLTLLAVTSVVSGGKLFSPGELSASAPSGEAIGGYTSHAELETSCELCHAPWLGVTDVRCMVCHAEVQAQKAEATGMHGVLPDVRECTYCHNEHEGRNYSSLPYALSRFNHGWTDFTLVEHRVDYDDQPMQCEACHGENYSADEERCANCHSEADPVFMADHINAFGPECLACHAGEGAVALTHDFFPLEGGHSNLQCAECHQSRLFSQTPTDCVGCHAEPEIHLGQFGTDCAVCHSISNWQETTLTAHTFPLDHEQERGQTIECLVCHPANYVTYTCYGSGCHVQAETEAKHIEENIVNFIDCMECHPDGREGEGREGGEGDDD